MCGGSVESCAYGKCRSELRVRASICHRVPGAAETGRRGSRRARDAAGRRQSRRACDGGVLLAPSLRRAREACPRGRGQRPRAGGVLGGRGASSLGGRKVGPGIPRPTEGEGHRCAWGARGLLTPRLTSTCERDADAGGALRAPGPRRVRCALAGGYPRPALPGRSSTSPATRTAGRSRGTWPPAPLRRGRGAADRASSVWCGACLLSLHRACPPRERARSAQQGDPLHVPP